MLNILKTISASGSSPIERMVKRHLASIDKFYIDVDAMQNILEKMEKQQKENPKQNIITRMKLSTLFGEYSKLCIELNVCDGVPADKLFWNFFEESFKLYNDVKNHLRPEDKEECDDVKDMKQRKAYIHQVKFAYDDFVNYRNNNILQVIEKKEE